MVAQIHFPSNSLHPSVKDNLHKEYVDFYNKYLINNPPVHQLPLSVGRGGGQYIVCHSKPLPVGRTQDISIRRRKTFGPDINIRCFTPPGTPPRSGAWPLVIYHHGGGWVFGDITSENTICTNMCIRANAVVITIDYRLAPEDVWPAAVHDSWEALLWAASDGAEVLNLDLSRVALSGASAGSNIAAVMAQKAVLNPLPGVTIRSQVLAVPITDNTATPLTNPTWKAYEFTAGLPASKMLWYRQHYLPQQVDWSHREASPLLASDEVFASLPPAVIIVAELDVLRSDGENYARKLKDNGVDADLFVIQGMPHPFIGMDGVLESGRRGITIMCDSLVKAFV